MQNTNQTHTTQIIKADSGSAFVEQLLSQGKQLSNRTMAYLGLVGEGAVLDVATNVGAIEGLKVGEKLELDMSPETQACNPALVKSIHMCGDSIVCNGAENLFAYPQAEPIVRAIARFLRDQNAKNVIFGGAPNGCGSWILPKTGTPVSLSSFGWGFVLPYEGHLITRDIVGGGAYALSPERLAANEIGRHNWKQFYAPTNGCVQSFGHRVRDGYLYVTLRQNLHLVTCAWDLRPLLKNQAIITKPVDIQAEWQSGWGTDIVGPFEQGCTFAVTSPNTNATTFYGLSPSTTGFAPRA